MTQTFRRRNLPHLYDSEGIYFITYCLADTFRTGINNNIYHNTYKCFDEFKLHFLKYDTQLHSFSSGNNYLAKKEIADTFRTTLHYPDGKEYKLICYPIMPDHIHLVFELLQGNKGISKIMQGIKGVSAKKCNLLLNRKGKFWQDESYDRWVRDDIELYFVIRYVLLNPVNAGLLDNWEKWEYTYCREEFNVL